MISCENNCLHFGLCLAADDKEYYSIEDLGCDCESFKNKYDYEKVVRCRKCKWCDRSQEPCHGRTEYYCNKFSTEVSKDNFCGYGIQR